MLLLHVAAILTQVKVPASLIIRGKRPCGLLPLLTLLLRPLLLLSLSLSLSSIPACRATGQLWVWLLVWLLRVCRMGLLPGGITSTINSTIRQLC